MRFVTPVGLIALMAWGANVGAEDKKGDKAKFDPATLVGKWEFVSGVKSGTKTEDKDLKADLDVTKDGMTLKSPDATFKFKYKLNVATDPVQIDLEMTESPFGAGAKAPGILKVEKGQLTLAYTPMGETRPTAFDGEKSHLYILKKKAAAKKE